MYFKESFDKEKIEKQHEELLNIFKEDLSNLSDKTIKKHIQNVDFFINEYLLNRNNANYDKFKKDDYKCLCDTIKDEMKSWQESCDYYDSGKPNWDPFKF